MHGDFIGAGLVVVERRHPHHVQPRLRKYRQQTGVGAWSAVVVARQPFPAGRQKLDNRIEIVRTGRHADHVALASRKRPHSGNGTITSKVTRDRLVHRKLRRRHRVHGDFIGAGLVVVERRHPHHVQPRLRKYRQQTGVGTWSAVVIARQPLPGHRQKVENRIECIRMNRYADDVARIALKLPNPGALTSERGPNAEQFLSHGAARTYRGQHCHHDDKCRSQSLGVALHSLYHLQCPVTSSAQKWFRRCSDLAKQYSRCQAATPPAQGAGDEFGRHSPA